VTDVLSEEAKFGDWRTDWGSQKINVPGTCPSPATFWCPEETFAPLKT
jgi:hypothetical protein